MGKEGESSGEALHHIWKRMEESQGEIKDKDSKAYKNTVLNLLLRFNVNNLWELNKYKDMSFCLMFYDIIMHWNIYTLNLESVYNLFQCLGLVFSNNEEDLKARKNWIIEEKCLSELFAQFGTKLKYYQNLVRCLYSW